MPVTPLLSCMATRNNPYKVCHLVTFACAPVRVGVSLSSVARFAVGTSRFYNTSNKWSESVALASRPPALAAVSPWTVV